MSTKTVLVVDDRAENREYLATLLGYQGLRVVQAADGREALERVRTERPELVICDILMPIMDGYEFVRQVRVEPDIAATPVVFCTAHYLEDEARSLARDCGVEDVLIKPCEPELVLAVLERCLGAAAKVAEKPRAKDQGFASAHLRLVTDKLSQTVEDLEQANAQLSALIELNVRLASERDVAMMLYKVCRGASDLFAARHGAISVRDRNDEESAYLTTTLDVEPPRKETHGRKDEGGALGRMAQQGIAMRMQRNEQSHTDVGLPQGFPDFDHMVAAPIMSLTRNYGWICLADKKGAAGFDDEDESLLATLGSQVGRIYENGSLYARVQRHANDLEAQIAERERAQRRLMAQYAVAHVLASGVSAEATISLLLETLCARLGFQAATLWEADRGAGRLRCVNAWPEKSKALSALAACSRALSLGQDEGVAGRAWRSAAPVFSNDLADDEVVERAHAAAAAGMRVAVAIPILIRNEVTGVVDLFAAACATPDQETLALYSALASQIGQFMERRAQDRQIGRLNRVHAVLSGITSTIVRTRDRGELFTESCRIVVEHGRFGAAWICDVDLESQAFSSAACAGVDCTEIADAACSQHASAERNSVLDRAVREVRAVCSNDLLAEPGAMPDIHRVAIEQGYRSLIALPLMVDGKVTACLGLVAEDPDFFTEDELRLLDELASDISFALQYIDKQEALLYLARYDPLTGLPNRQAFMERLSQRLKIEGSSQLALMIVDLRQFRRINDSFGRAAGDAMLREMAERLREHVGDVSRLARVAADAFAIAAPNIRAATDIALLLRSTLLPALSVPYRIDNQELVIGCSIGIALYPGDGKHAETLFGHAEVALRNAKSGGERYLFYQPEMNARTADILLLEHRLRIAVDEQQFVLHYQPIVDVRTRQLRTLEALIRWQGPDGLLVPPGEFIPLLEETGMILDVGAWVLDSALRDRQCWRKTCVAPFRVAVNVSPLQLRREEFVSMVAQAIATDRDAGLELEITESLVMQDIDSNIVKLTALREMGVSIAIDDFGTGYSSLAYLARLPVNALKIDRAFIAAMSESGDGTAIVATIIALAHSMGVEVIAEGVETEAQAAKLAELGCDHMQGYLIARPMPADEIARFVPGHGA